MYKVTPNSLIDVLAPLYSVGENVPTVMLWGQPGVGKSDSVRALAKKVGEMTKKETIVHDVRLLLFNPVDLRGIPVPDANKEFAKWLRPLIFNIDPNPNKLHFLLLDEITAAPPSVQASAYQLTLDRKVGEHELPDNVIIIGAGNRVQDKGVAYKMPTPLANRMSHFEVTAELEDWKQWAIPSGIHELVLGFLNFKETYLNKFDPSSDESAFPTPRSWAFVSKYLNIFKNVDSAYPMIASTIGEGAAVEFKAFAKTYGSLPDVNKILNGEKVPLPQDKYDILCALSSSIVAKAPKATLDQLKNVLNFTKDSGLSAEFAVLTVRDLIRVPGVKEKLLVTKEWTEWAKNYKNLIN
jgi:hypothetical protein